MKEDAIIKDEAELDKLSDKFFHGSISTRDKKKLYDHYFALLGMDRNQAALLIVTSHPDYGKPDENGIISII